jgi:hypothetical protein
MKPSLSKTVTIALCGAQSRIGTTTQSFQLLQYLQIRGYDVAFIDLSGNGYIDLLRKLYGGVEKNGSCIIYEGIHMYQSVLDLNESYQYLVKDYGSFQNDNFNEISYLEQDIHIVCSGVKPNEIFEVSPILQKSEFNRAKFIFSFVPPDNRSAILKQMTNRAANTFFVGYNPDSFSYDATSNKVYRQIIGEFLSEELIPPPKKANLFVKALRNAKRLGSMLGSRLKTVHGILTLICVYTIFLVAILFKIGVVNF